MARAWLAASRPAARRRRRNKQVVIEVARSDPLQSISPGEMFVRDRFRSPAGSRVGRSGARSLAWPKCDFWARLVVALGGTNSRRAPSLPVWGTGRSCASPRRGWGRRTGCDGEACLGSRRPSISERSGAPYPRANHAPACATTDRRAVQDTRSQILRKERRGACPVCLPLQAGSGMSRVAAFSTKAERVMLRLRVASSTVSRRCVRGRN